MILLEIGLLVFLLVEVEKGDTGDIGVGISSIARTSGDGSAGSVDTYTITLTDLTIHEGLQFTMELIVI